MSYLQRNYSKEEIKETISSVGYYLFIIFCFLTVTYLGTELSEVSEHSQNLIKQTKYNYRKHNLEKIVNKNCFVWKQNQRSNVK